METDRMETASKPNINVEVHVKSVSTAKLSEVRTQVEALLNRHSVFFGNYKWTEFDEEFLQRNVESVAIVDLEVMSQLLDLKSCSVSIHIFTLNEEVPNMLNLQEDEDLSAANHWMLPAESPRSPTRARQQQRGRPRSHPASREAIPAPPDRSMKWHPETTPEQPNCTTGFTAPKC
ncbi:pachytene checkpoint protein 2-like protein [Nothobranchius furzeri]|uniref:Pachytene checkpoint protein 2 homolog n=1 Tax=Nothobranchius furzeri TaxID=105023 RepID=A0A9D2YW15_NOTFU|nr:pachytene checkpoint protein 2 homolog [Nothobranchius furzeri]KAF7227691.1 pachytene checkpoint protein 2-like protein [Nothobranchius furzeri]